MASESRFAIPTLSDKEHCDDEESRSQNQAVEARRTERRSTDRSRRRQGSEGRSGSAGCARADDVMPFADAPGLATGRVGDFDQLKLTIA
jgi:hypothetical protein